MSFRSWKRHFFLYMEKPYIDLIWNNSYHIFKEKYILFMGENMRRKILTRTKKLVFQIFSIMSIFVMLSNFSIVLAEEIVNNAEDKAKALIEISISKYNNFNIGEKKGSLVQFNVKTGIEYKDNQNYGAIK